MKILHVLRAPVGGLFRHVIDLAEGQIDCGHKVGIVADSTKVQQICEAKLTALQPRLALGLHRIPISRRPGPSDLVAMMRVSRIVRATRPDIVHGHGAKGGALARLAAAPSSVIRAYTPHGGSLHSGRIAIVLERMLKARGQLYLFESAFSQNFYLDRVGKPSGLVRVIHNGLRDEEFEGVALQADAADVVYLGEMRALKGVDILIEALAKSCRNGQHISAALVGDGPDAEQFRGLVNHLGLSGLVTFHKSMTTRKALALGRIVVVPSRAESLPYVVLEALAAGKPIVATNVGGIPEIFGSHSDSLVPPENADALAAAIQRVSTAPDIHVHTATLRNRVKERFSVKRMTDLVLDSYLQLCPSPDEASPDISLHWRSGSALRRKTRPQNTSPTYT